MTSSSVKSIMSKRVLVPAQAANKRTKLLVQGDGNVIDVLDKEGNEVHSTIKGEEGVILQKRIFNLRANSQLAMTNERTRSYFMDGLKAEKAGDTTKADELFSKYLNSCQLSFGIILPSGIAESLGNGVQIECTVLRVDTDNGSLLTIDPSTIRVATPEEYEATAFSMEDFEAEITAEETAAAAAKPATKKPSAKVTA